MESIKCSFKFKSHVLLFVLYILSPIIFDKEAQSFRQTFLLLLVNVRNMRGCWKIKFLNFVAAYRAWSRYEMSLRWVVGASYVFRDWKTQSETRILWWNEERENFVSRKREMKKKEMFGVFQSHLSSVSSQARADESFLSSIVPQTFPRVLFCWTERKMWWFLWIHFSSDW